MDSAARPSQRFSRSDLTSHSWGGRRPGAGRKRVADRPATPHRARPLHSTRHPVLVTLRSWFRPLRSQHLLPTLRSAIAGANQRAPHGFRVTQYTIQYDHMHMIVEASNKRALSSGMRSIVIRIARSVNALVGRRGRFWADRWHGRALKTPRQVRTALVYVLANFRKHARRVLAPGVDPFSSGAWFDGWLGSSPRVSAFSVPNRSVEAHPTGPDGPIEPAPVLGAQTWLARDGWRQLGLLRLDDSPAGAPGHVRSDSPPVATCLR
jgi:REP element-mobilizing transposase RayT